MPYDNIESIVSTNKLIRHLMCKAEHKIETTLVLGPFCSNIKSQSGSRTKGSTRMHSVIVTHIRCDETGTGRPSGCKTNRMPPSPACLEGSYLSLLSTCNEKLFLMDWKYFYHNINRLNIEIKAIKG